MDVGLYSRRAESGKVAVVQEDILEIQKEQLANLHNKVWMKAKLLSSRLTFIIVEVEGQVLPDV